MSISTSLRTSLLFLALQILFKYTAALTRMVKVNAAPQDSMRFWRNMGICNRLVDSDDEHSEMDGMTI